VCAPPLPRERLARAGGMSLAGSVFAAVLAFVLAVVVGRGLGTSGTGLFFQVIGLFTIAATVLRLGADTGLVRSLSQQTATGRTADLHRTVIIALAPVVAIGVIAAVALWLFAPTVADLLAVPAERDEMISLVRWLAPFVGIAALLSVLLGGLRGIGRVAPYVLVQNVAVPVSRLALVLIAIGVGAGFAGSVLGWAAPLPVWCLAAAVLLIRQLAKSVRGTRSASATPRGPLARQFWGFSSARGIAAAIEITLEWADVLLVAALASTSDAGIYAVVTRCVRAGQVVDQALRVTVGPRISALLATGEIAEARRLYAAGTKAMVLLTWPFYLMLAVMGPAILGLFGPGFRAGAPVLLVISIAMMLMAAAGMLQSVLLMGGRSSWQMRNKAVELVVSITLNMILIPALGILGAGVTWAAVVLLDLGMAGWQVHRRLGVGLSLRTIRTPMLLTLGVFGVGGIIIRGILGATFLGLVVFVAALSVVYLGLVWLTRSGLGLDATGIGTQRANGRHVRRATAIVNRRG
jgi:O-antigen/teichoic acid export membrane protein